MASFLSYVPNSYGDLSLEGSCPVSFGSNLYTYNVKDLIVNTLLTKGRSSNPYIVENSYYSEKNSFINTQAIFSFNTSNLTGVNISSAKFKIRPELLQNLDDQILEIYAVSFDNDLMRDVAIKPTAAVDLQVYNSRIRTLYSLPLQTKIAEVPIRNFPATINTAGLFEITIPNISFLNRTGYTQIKVVLKNNSTGSLPLKKNIVRLNRITAVALLFLPKIQLELTINGSAITVPTAPEDVIATSQNQSVKLEWSTPSSDGGVGLNKYVIYKKIVGGPTETIVLNNTSTTHTVSGLQTGQTYIFSVVAQNIAGLSSTPSENLTVSLTSSAMSFPLKSWNTVGGSTVFNGIQDLNLNGISVLSRNNSGTDLYTPPSDKYPSFDKTGCFTIKAVWRKQSPSTTSQGIVYAYPPSQNSTTDIVDSTLASAAMSAYFQSVYNVVNLPSLTRINSLLNYYGSPSDIWKLYTDYVSNFTNPYYAFAVNHDSGATGVNVWKTNASFYPDMPNWPYAYSYTRPFLLFDTSLIGANATLTTATLSFKKRANYTIQNPQTLIMRFHKANVSSNTNLDYTDFNNFTSTVVGSISLNDPTLLSGDVVTVPIDVASITKGGFTKFAVTLNNEPIAPTNWTQACFESVVLNISQDTLTQTIPTQPSNFTATPANGSVSLSWTSPGSNGGSGITGYVTKNLTTGESHSPVSASTFTDTFYSLTNGTLYTFEVRAINSIGTGDPAIASATPVSVGGGGETVVVPGLVLDLHAVAGDSKATLSWVKPSSDGGSAILGYLIRNNTTSETFTINATTSSQYSREITGLTNNTEYSFTVNAYNIAGNGDGVNVSITPTADATVPGLPIIYNLSVGNRSASINWNPPTEDGGSAILGWKIKLAIYGQSTGIQIYESSDPELGTYFFDFLNNGTPYTLSVAAVNLIGTGPYAMAEPFVPNSSGTSTPTVVIDYNYQKFYTAPIDLNPNSANYLGYIYPKEVVEITKAIIGSNGVTYPISISSSNNILYLNISEVDFTVEIPQGYYTLEDLGAYLGIALASTSVTVSIANGTLILTNNEEGLDKNLDYSQEIGYVNEANTTIFGTEPVFVAPYELYHVKDHVPTTEYDATHEKVLIESRPYTTIMNSNISKGSLFTSSTTTSLGNNYAITLPNKFIRQNSITIQYFDPNNNPVYLRDYFGDGRLLIRKKNQTLPGDPITYTYPRDERTFINPTTTDVTKPNAFGLIDYREGRITNLLFPTLVDSNNKNYSSFKPAIILGKNVSWPITINRDSFLYLEVNGTLMQYFIPANTIGQKYTLDQIIALLNNTDNQFYKDGLVAGNKNNQLYIVNSGLNINIGPNKTLKPYNNPGSNNSCNSALLGITPYLYTTSNIYITYSFTTYNPSKYAHLWYQTPHFAIVSKEDPSQFITKAHLDYLLNKLNIIRPATTVLDTINIAPAFEEEINSIEEFTINSDNGTISAPYITFIMPNYDGTFEIGVAQDVTIINPDSQTDTETDFFTFS
jgi:hypothetical protein